jgi:hypothetical protein
MDLQYLFGAILNYKQDFKPQPDGNSTGLCRSYSDGRKPHRRSTPWYPPDQPCGTGSLSGLTNIHAIFVWSTKAASVHCFTVSDQRHASNIGHNSPESRGPEKELHRRKSSVWISNSGSCVKFSTKSAEKPTRACQRNLGVVIHCRSRI